MSSGFGIKGGSGRCYPIWTDFSACLSTAEEPSKCKDFRDDYLECLHHRKEFIRLNTLFREAKFQEDHDGESSTHAKHHAHH